jgi:hypothetical protein
VSHGAREVAGELLLELVPLVNRVFLERLELCKWSLVQTEREVEALRVVVATSVLDGEGVASEPLYWILLCIVLGDPQRFEFLWEQQIVKSSREGGEAVALACRGGFLASNFFDSAVSIIATASDTGDVAICVASASAIASATGSPSSPV